MLSGLQGTPTEAIRNEKLSNLKSDTILAELEGHARALAERLNIEGSSEHAHQARNLEAMIAAARRILEREQRQVQNQD